MLDKTIIVTIIAIVIPIIMCLIYLLIDKAFVKHINEQYGRILKLYSDENYYAFYYRNSMEKKEQEYIKRISDLNKDIKELQEQSKLQENTINVLNNIIQQCLNNSINNNHEIIKELEELEEENKRKGEII